MWPPEVSYVVLCSSLLSCRFIVSLSSPLSVVFPSFWFHVHNRCMLFWGIVHSSSDSDVQSIIAACSVFGLLFRFWYLICCIFLRFLSCLFFVTSSIFRRHVISNMSCHFQSLCFSKSQCPRLRIIQYRLLNISTSYTWVFLWPCSVPWSSTYSPAPAKSPRQTNSPFHILIRPLLCADLPSQIHKVLRLLQFLSFHLQAKISCFPLPKIGILFSVCLSSCPFFGSPVRLLSASSVIPFPDIIRKSHIFYPFTSDVSPLRLIHPMSLP